MVIPWGRRGFCSTPSSVSPSTVFLGGRQSISEIAKNPLVRRCTYDNASRACWIGYPTWVNRVREKNGSIGIIREYTETHSSSFHQGKHEPRDIWLRLYNGYNGYDIHLNKWMDKCFFFFFSFRREEII